MSACAHNPKARTDDKACGAPATGECELCRRPGCAACLDAGGWCPDPFAETDAAPEPQGRLL